MSKPTQSDAFSFTKLLKQKTNQLLPWGWLISSNSKAKDTEKAKETSKEKTMGATRRDKGVATKHRIDTDFQNRYRAEEKLYSWN